MLDVVSCMFQNEFDNTSCTDAVAELEFARRENGLRHCSLIVAKPIDPHVVGVIVGSDFSMLDLQSYVFSVKLHQIIIFVDSKGHPRCGGKPVS